MDDDHGPQVLWAIYALVAGEPDYLQFWGVLLLKLIIVIVCGILSAIFSGSEVAILSVKRIRMMELKEEGNKAALILLKILEKPSQIVSTLLVANTTVNVVMVVLWTNSLISLSVLYGWSSFILVVGGLFLTMVIILFCEILPKNLFHSNPEFYVLHYARFLYLTIRTAHWLVWLTYNASKLVLRVFGITLSSGVTLITEEEIIDLIETGEEEGIIQEQEKEMIHSIFEFGDLRVRDVMVPRVDMIALRQTANVADALAKVVDTGHSRIPIYGKDRDDIIGLLYAKDLLDKLGDENVEDNTLQDLIQDVEYVPEEMPLSNLFKLMKRKKNHFAIVVDEYGGTAGFVTIEDILEEIVGEIQDEYDQQETTVKEDKGVWVVEGKLNLHDLEDLVDIEIPQNGADTVGGLIYSELGRIPDVGNIIELAGLTFKILRVNNQRITEIEIRKAKKTRHATETEKRVKE
ncbi:hemolysin family protein [bacterium]|nr:hemolysin family protein [bacterium]MBU1024729.1 hemolysin family protein [bacterium]